MNGKDFLLIIPAYNEGMNIGRVLEDLKTSEFADRMDILVIDDGSVDDTCEQVRRAGVNVISQCFNMGYGAALQTGYKYAVKYGYSYVFQMDADGQHDVRNLAVLYQRLCGTGERVPDIVIGSRFLEGSESFYISGLKKAAIGIFRAAIHHFTGYRLTDPTSGLQGLNRRAFTYYAGYSHFDTKYPDLNMIMQMLLLGFHIEETPAIMHERIAGVSMHTGLLKTGRYMIVMLLSTMSAFIRFHHKDAKSGKGKK